MTSTSDLSSTKSADVVVRDLHRDEWGRLLSLLVARTRRLDLAEDALSEAFARALTGWRADGVPANPVGWIVTTARRQIIERIRSEAIAGRKAPMLVARSTVEPDGPIDELADDRLSLILLCCHPALPLAARSALALRLVIGTSTDQIARLFLVPTPTMAARLTRAKRKIVVAGIPLTDSVGDELAARLDEVCRTIYLAFTAGYTPGSGPDLLRADLAGDAVRLARVLHDVAPNAPQIDALIALLTLQHSRRDARQVDGRLVTLTEQDRSRWHRVEIDAGLAVLDRLEPTDGYAEELRLQAVIAAEHARAIGPAHTDWQKIAEHYGRLESITGSPVVRLNRAVAVAEVDGPRAGLDMLGGIDEAALPGHRLAAVRADLARRAGDARLARRSYLAALDRCDNEVERRFLEERLAAVEEAIARGRA